MASCVIAPQESGWIVIGARGSKLFKTKTEALLVGKRMANATHSPLIIKNKLGLIESVSVYRNTNNKNRLRSANVKNRLNSKRLRNSIAQALLSREGV
jgi:hypothetical protein